MHDNITPYHNRRNEFEQDALHNAVGIIIGLIVLPFAFLFLCGFVFYSLITNNIRKPNKK